MDLNLLSKNNILVSKIQDNNIFHIFFEIIQYYSSNYQDIYIYENNIDKNNPCQKWRVFVMQKMYGKTIKYTNLLINNHRFNNGYNHNKFIKFQASNYLIELVKNIASTEKPEYILFNQRKPNNRYLYDYKTKLPLDDYLKSQNLNLPLKTCCFDDLNVKEQYDICSKAIIFITMHGAACTNLIFTPLNTPLIEINFRTHWYCDGVCDDHFNGKISINEKCNGTLMFPEYHKADYHNLCYLLGKKYYEISPIEYSGKFLNRNPISKENIFIDGDNLVKLINIYIKIINYI